MPERSVSVVTAADILAENRSKHAGVFTCGQLSALAKSYQNLAQTTIELEISNDRPLCREAHVQQHSITTSVLINTAL